MPQAPADILESMIDTYGLAEVLSKISIICAEKADHIEASYSHSGLLVKLWRDCSNEIGKVCR